MLPLVDVAPLLDRSGVDDVARRLDSACRRFGFARIVGHGVDPALQRRLLALAGEFFAQPDLVKAEIAMERAGAAWRGWFPVGAETTSGIADVKEGIYFGADSEPGLPLHGRNLYPESPAGLGDAVSAWMESMTGLGQSLLGALAIGLGLDEGWFARHVTGDPTTLFRIFHYPGSGPGSGSGSDSDGWGVREHTDYGLLTILAQDGTDGLQVRGPDGWLDVPGDPDVLVVNLGDMFERMTRGLYPIDTAPGAQLDWRRPAVVAVLPRPVVGRAPAPIESLDPTDVSSGPHPRWDGADVHAWQGRYGDYLTAKVAKVFPHLLHQA